MPDLDAGAKAIHNDAAGAVLDRTQERPGVRMVVLVDMQCDGQLSVEPFKQCTHGRKIGAAHDERRCAEDFAIASPSSGIRERFGKQIA